MALYNVLLLCVHALLVQIAVSQFVGPAIGAGLGPIGASLGPIGAGLSPIGPGLSPLGAGHGFGAGIAPFGSACAGAASTGGGFPVTSASPIAPTGVSIVSENAIEGALTVGGNLPLLGSVTVEGAFPTAGAGAISYGCGDGAVGIASESPIATGIVGPGPLGPVGPLAGPLGSLAGGPVRYGPGLGCGAIY